MKRLMLMALCMALPVVATERKDSKSLVNDKAAAGSSALQNAGADISTRQVSTRRAPHGSKLADFRQYGQNRHRQPGQILDKGGNPRLRHDNTDLATVQLHTANQAYALKGAAKQLDRLNDHVLGNEGQGTRGLVDRVQKLEKLDTWTSSSIEKLIDQRTAESLNLAVTATIEKGDFATKLAKIEQALSQGNQAERQAMLILADRLKAAEAGLAQLRQDTGDVVCSMLNDTGAWVLDTTNLRNTMKKRQFCLANMGKKPQDMQQQTRTSPTNANNNSSAAVTSTSTASSSSSSAGSSTSAVIVQLQQPAATENKDNKDNKAA